MISRRGLLVGAGGLALAGSAGTAYAVYVEPHLRLVVTRYALTPPGWTRGLRVRAAVLSDIHAGEPSMPMERVARLVDMTNALEPDVVLMLGDYSGTGATWRDEAPWSVVARALARLRAPLGVHAVAGNHEWWSDMAAQRRRAGPSDAFVAFTDAGLPFLENGARRLTKEGRAFWILGLGDQIAFRLGNRRFQGTDDLAGTLAARTDDAPAILLAHEPDIFPRVPASVSLTLSGHTHGGQVRLLGYSPIVPSMYGNRYAYGHVVEDGRHLVVSGGIGTVRAGIARLRFAVPPEIVLLDLG